MKYFLILPCIFMFLGFNFSFSAKTKQLKTENLGLKVEINFKKEQFLHLINWQHWGRNEYVTGIEPATNLPIGQAQARANNELIFLNPHEIKSFDLEMNISENTKS